MTRRVVTASLDDTIETTMEIFEQAEFHHLLVVEDGKLQGSVSDRDLLRAEPVYRHYGGNSARCIDVEQADASDHEPHADNATIRRRRDGGDPAHPISCIPIVDTGSRPGGIVSWRNVLKACAAARVTGQSAPLSCGVSF
jgi:acetoin utilization protein AcuB